VKIMRKALSAAVFAVLWLSAVPVHADVASGWQAFLDGDYATAVAELEPAAQAGDATAQYYLGVLYDHGDGVTRSYQTAAEWYEKAANQGHSDAQFKLGLLYYTGGGQPTETSAIKRDPKTAARWFAPAAEAGHPMASYLLCRLVDEGRWVERSLDRALSLCRTAANLGVPGAQYNTGLLLAEQSTDRESWTEAYTWFLLASRARYPGAKQNLDVVAKWLNEADIIQAEAAADAWQPKN
jgi:TPR repeat protein